MKKSILLIITITILSNVSYASFPIDNNIISVNLDPTTDSWILIIILFWSLVIIIPILMYKLYKKNSQKNKDN